MGVHEQAERDEEQDEEVALDECHGMRVEEERYCGQ
jgi:hypothetical protein